MKWAFRLLRRDTNRSVVIHDQVLLTRGGCTERRRRPDNANRHCINSTSLHLLLLGFWPWSSILIPKRRDPQEIFCILWNRKFITVFTTGHHYSWFWAKCTEFTTFHYFLRSILILPFLHLLLTVGSFLQVFSLLPCVLDALSILSTSISSP